VFDLSGDGGHGERPEVLAAVRRPSVGCLDQTDERELFEVSAFHAVVEIARGDRPRHRQVLDDDLVTAPLLFGRVGAGGQVIEFFPQLATAVPGWGARSGRRGMIAVFVGNRWRGGQGTCRHGTLRGDRHPSWHLFLDQKPIPARCRSRLNGGSNWHLQEYPGRQPGRPRRRSQTNDSISSRPVILIPSPASSSNTGSITPVAMMVTARLVPRSDEARG